MKRGLLLCVLYSLPAFASIDGTILNQSTGKPQGNVVIQLVQPGQAGMQTLGTAKSDAGGKFSFDRDAQGPTLIQAIYQGVLYNKMITPGAPSSGLEVPVYNSSKTPNGAKITQHFILLQPTGAELNVSESYLYRGDPKTTYNDAANGTLRVYIPPEAKGAARVMILGPGGMPIPRSAEATAQPDVYKIDYPVKPGETRFDVSYTLPSTDPLMFSGKLLQHAENTDLVVPSGVTLKGDNIQSIGLEPKTQASIYKVEGDSFKVEIQGVGSLQSGPGEEDSGMPTIQQVNPRIYDHMYWILGIAFTILGLGSFLLYRRGTGIHARVGFERFSTPPRHK